MAGGTASAVQDLARYRRAIHVHIKDIEKDADPHFAGAEVTQRHNLAIRRRDQHIAVWRNSLRIAEEV
jgi:hypothetical protein